MNELHEESTSSWLTRIAPVTSADEDWKEGDYFG